MADAAPVRVVGRRAALVLREDGRTRDAAVAIEFADGTLVGFLHFRRDRDKSFTAYFELSDDVEEIGVARAGRLISLQRKEAPDATV